MRKKFITGAAVLALLMNSPQVSAEDDIVIFGGEFENDKPAPKKVEKPAPKKELPPKPEVVAPQNKSPENSKSPEQKSPPKTPAPPVKPEVVKPPENLPPRQPVEKAGENQPVNQPPVETDKPFTSPAEIAGNQEKVVEPPIVSQPPVKKIDEPPIVSQPPVKKIDEPPIVSQPPAVRPVESPRRAPVVRDAYTDAPSEYLKTLKPRFIKLAVDETYTYYLDKSSVQWKRMPYSSSEYIADVWIRMVERKPKALDNDMAAYGADNFKAEIDLAREKGYQYSPEDLKVLCNQAYVLEHYYLRPKTQQIQFLCELEVFGRPQNTVNERAYDYQNWENLVPGSVESIIYAATIKTIGKSKSSERGHMTFFDMLDEYARIALN